MCGHFSFQEIQGPPSAVEEVLLSIMNGAVYYLPGFVCANCCSAQLQTLLRILGRMFTWWRGWKFWHYWHEIMKCLQTFAMPHMFWEYDGNGVPSRLRDGEFLPFIEADQILLVWVARSQSDLFSSSSPPWSASAPVSFYRKGSLYPVKWERS